MVLPPDPPPAADRIVIESTYGNRLHPAIETLARRAAKRGAVMLVPSFAMGRALSLLLGRTMEARRALINARTAPAAWLVRTACV